MTKMTPEMESALKLLQGAYTNETVARATAEAKYRELVESAVSEATAETDRLFWQARQKGTPMNRIAPVLGHRNTPGVYPRWKRVQERYAATEALTGAAGANAERPLWALELVNSPTEGAHANRPTMMATHRDGEPGPYYYSWDGERVTPTQDDPRQPFDQEMKAATTTPHQAAMTWWERGGPDADE